MCYTFQTPSLNGGCNTFQTSDFIRADITKVLCFYSEYALVSPGNYIDNGDLIVLVILIFSYF